MIGSPVHPRVCGEPAGSGPVNRPWMGPSPRVRGTRPCRPSARARRRSIPACAGNPIAPASPCSADGVHPRVCGEPDRCGFLAQIGPGPSPRVRGTRGAAGAAVGRRGSIPACAGNPGRRGHDPATRAVHPRVCGEPAVQSSALVPRSGPSPRVRGTPGGRTRSDPASGSIPACAGNPSSWPPTTAAARVHPRVCGEPAAGIADAAIVEGPSPRVRGTRAAAGGGADGVGSIPACAGNPGRRPARSSSAGVHPRVCGEPALRWPNMLTRTGPSPRVRGTRERAGGGASGAGSIPACAGNPPAPRSRTGD